MKSSNYRNTPQSLIHHNRWNIRQGGIHKSCVRKATTLIGQFRQGKAAIFLAYIPPSIFPSTVCYPRLKSSVPASCVKWLHQLLMVMPSQHLRRSRRLQVLFCLLERSKVRHPIFTQRPQLMLSSHPREDSRICSTKWNGL
jgi:hypothetical protein